MPAPEVVRVYALRLRTGLFGANAPDWRVMPDTVQDHYEDDSVLTTTTTTTTVSLAPASGGSSGVSGFGGNVIGGKIVVGGGLDGPDDWPGFTVVPPGAAANTVDLDGDHPQVGPGSWLVLQRATTVELYRVQSATALTRSDYALSGKVTRVVLASGPNVATTFAGGVRTTVALAQSERLELAEAPLTAPVQGRTLTLAGPLEPPLPAGHVVVVSGPAPRLAVADGVHELSLVTASGAVVALHPGEVLVATAPATVPAESGASRWTVRRLLDGAEGTVDAHAGCSGGPRRRGRRRGPGGAGHGRRASPRRR